MKCVVCKNGETGVGLATVTLERSGVTLVFKSVPANICLNCGEKFVSESVTARLIERAEADVVEGVKVVIREFQAA